MEARWPFGGRRTATNLMVQGKAANVVRAAPYARNLHSPRSFCSPKQADQPNRRRITLESVRAHDPLRPCGDAWRPALCERRRDAAPCPDVAAVGART